MSNDESPDVIYLDADSEITEAIDKLKAAHGHEVRVAVPARSAMLQSAVNLKLLKKTAHTAGKKLILVSSDKATLSLAAGLGMLVAKNVKAEAEVPDMAMAPPEVSSEPVVIEQAVEESAKEAKAAKKARKSKNSKEGFEKQRIDLDEETPQEPAHHPSHQAVPQSKGKGPKVPNFTGLNKKIGLIAGVLAVIIALVLAYIFLPTANATLVAKAQKTPVNVKFVLDSTTRKSDYSQGIVAADQLSITKDLSAQYTATGKKDVGTKANGSVAVKNCEDTNPHALPAGAKLTSGGKSFTTNGAVNIPAGSFSGGGTVCTSSTVSVGITSDANGDSYNMSNATFAVAGMSAKITATGSTSGGTSKVAVVVTQEDIDKAKKDMIDQATTSAKQDVSNKAGSDQKVFDETFTSDVTGVTASAPVDSESAGGTVSAKVKYSMLSAAKSDLDKLFFEQIKTQIPANNQVYQSGAADAKYTIKLNTPDKADAQAVSNAYYGQNIDSREAAKALAGKSKKDATDAITPKFPQVTSVQVETNPALSPNLPFFASRITIQIKVSTD